MLHPKKSYVTPISTNEDGRVLYGIYTRQTEASIEHDPELGAIQIQTQNFPSKKLWELWTQRQRGPKEKPCGWRSLEAILAYLLEYAAQAGWEEFPDGIHWNENLDPYVLSAPRAGICTFKIKTGGLTLTS